MRRTRYRTRLPVLPYCGWGLDGAPTDGEDDWLTIELAEAVMAKKPVCLIASMEPTTS